MSTYFIEIFIEGHDTPIDFALNELEKDKLQQTLIDIFHHNKPSSCILNTLDKTIITLPNEMIRRSIIQLREETGIEIPEEQSEEVEDFTKKDAVA